MTKEEYEAYYAGRYQQMLDYYDRRAIWSKRAYMAFSVYVIVGSFVLTGVAAADFSWTKVVTAVLAPTIGISAALLSLFKFHENWLRYRSTWDCLKREPHYRAAGLREYSGHSDPNLLFVERVEALIAREGAEWLETHACEDRKEKKAKPSTAIRERRY